MITRFAFILSLTLPMLGQTAPAPLAVPTQARPIHLQEFLDLVAQTNLDLAANWFNVTVADAQITLARLRPDPQATAGIAALDLTSQDLPTSTTYGLSQEIELGGKRGARIAAAQAGRSVAEAQVEDFFQQLRVDATNAFIDALTAREVLARKRRTLESVQRLVTATEERVHAGDVSETALWQVRVEAERFRGEVLTAEGDSQVADIALEAFVAPKTGDVLTLQPTGDLNLAPRAFDVSALIAEGLAHRTELLVSIRAAEAARAQLDLVKANRWLDPAVSGGITQSPASAALQIPASRLLALSLSLHIPFSHATHGDVDAAKALASQADTQTLSVKRRVEVEVRQALARYEASRRTVAVYAGEVLANADRALEATRYSYERGNARLVELLDAQRTVDDVYLSYLAALADHAKALVALERASGRWDVTF
jgi:outer membrane protein, heavy metal efflux system